MKDHPFSSFSRKFSFSRKRSLNRYFKSFLADYRGDRQVAEAFVVLVLAVAKRDGLIDVSELDELKVIFSSRFPELDVEKIIQNSPKISNSEIDNSCIIFVEKNDLKANEELLKTLFEVAYANADCSEKKYELISRIAENLKVSSEKLPKLQSEIFEKFQRKAKLLNSGAGIIAALAILAIFVFTAVFLKPVLFGILLSAIFLPVEKFLERRLDNNFIVGFIIGFCETIVSPFRKLGKYISTKLKFHQKHEVLSEHEKEERNYRSLVGRATAATVAFALIAFSVVVILLGTMTYFYASGIKTKISSWASEQVVERQGQNKTVSEVEGQQIKESKNQATSSFINKLEEYKKELIAQPIVNELLLQLHSYISDRENQLKIMKGLLSKSSGVLGILNSIFSKVVNILFNTLMTIFFFSLILRQMALFIGKQKISVANYIVDSIFKTSWLPQTGNAARKSATEIVENIFHKLRIWVKGYFSIICIESFLYVIAFALIGVPYAPLLGVIAGLTILLPYIGPLASGTLTVLICLASGGAASGAGVILLIVVVYIVMNGIVEQLVLYPTMVGNALGLTTLETIVVVLLGGYFAGLAGMIFAVPVASVSKYIIPKIYSSFNKKNRVVVPG